MQTVATLHEPTTEELDAALAVTLGELWEVGKIHLFLLDADQLEQSRELWASPDEYVCCISRQRGKSYWAVVECVCLALRKPGASIKYAAGTQKAVRAIIEPLMREILATCPERLRPSFDSVRSVWLWPNGSELTCAGVDNGHYESLRGTKADMVVRDEAGFFEAADWDAIDAVLAPQLLTTGGLSLIVSSPPESPAHPFHRRFLSAVAAGRAKHRSINGHPRLSKEQVALFLAREARARGMTPEEYEASSHFRREYLAEFVTEETRAAVPAWTVEAAKDLVRAIERPAHFDWYSSLDPGFGDPHAGLAAWWHFELQALVVEYEFELRGGNTQQMAEAFKAMEREAWGANVYQGKLRGAKDWEHLPDWLKAAAAADAPHQPLLRVGDNDSLVLADLQQLHGIAVLPTRKDEKHLAVNDLDIMVRARKFFVHPRCVRLIEQLYGTTWNSRRNGWERTAKDHGDLLDNAVYLVRNVRRHLDPRPKHPNHMTQAPRQDAGVQAMRKMFGLR